MVNKAWPLATATANFCIDMSRVVLLLQAYYRSLEQIDGLRHSVQFPKLESPPADFLEQMENYVREAPRHVSENGVPQNKKVSRHLEYSIYLSGDVPQTADFICLPHTANIDLKPLSFMVCRSAFTALTCHLVKSKVSAAIWIC